MKQQQKAGPEDDEAAKSRTRGRCSSRKPDMRMKQQQEAGQEDDAAAGSQTWG